MRLGAVHVDRVKRFALEIDEESGRTFVSFPVTNTKVDYTEWYEIDPATFDLFTADPGLALGFVEHARNQQLDHLRLFAPGLLNDGPRRRLQAGVGPDPHATRPRRELCAAGGGQAPDAPGRFGRARAGPLCRRNEHA
jgi:hypothetical protein